MTTTATGAKAISRYAVIAAYTRPDSITMSLPLPAASLARIVVSPVHFCVVILVGVAFGFVVLMCAWKVLLNVVSCVLQVVW